MPAFTFDLIFMVIVSLQMGRRSKRRRLFQQALLDFKPRMVF
jgi:hypothetical protein